MSKRNKLIFFSQDYEYLKEQLEKTEFDFDEGKIERRIFPDGERYQNILSSVDNRHVVIIGGTINDSATLEIYELACAISKYGAKSLTIVCPYFGHSTMERAIRPGEVVTAKTRTRLLSAIPPAKYGNRIFLFDLHSEGIPHYFTDNITPTHIYCKSLVIEACREIAGNESFVLASCDAGRAKWIESLANSMNVKGAFVFKRRISGSETEVTSINADVKDKKVIIYDDMIRTGGSLINAAKAYKDAGATEISVVTTHGIFAGNGFERLKESGLFANIVCTDTHPNALNFKRKGMNLKIKSIAGLIANALKRCND